MVLQIDSILQIDLILQIDKTIKKTNLIKSLQNTKTRLSNIASLVSYFFF